jgi:hypothetical protein
MNTKQTVRIESPDRTYAQVNTFEKAEIDQLKKDGFIITNITIKNKAKFEFNTEQSRWF